MEGKLDALTLRMPAKVNLSLDVTGRREDGYHLLRMAMQTVSLYDTLTLRLLSDTPGVRVFSNVRFLPADRRNLAVDAAYRFFERLALPLPALELRLDKRIPVAAGLAGGSADAAGVLLGLNRLYGKPLSPEALAALGLTLGADVPYCLTGGTMLAEGIGETLTPLRALPDCRIVLCKPPVSVSTASVFSRLRWCKLRRHPDTPGLLRGLADGSLPDVARRMFNVLETVTVPLCPAVREIEELFLEYSALGTVMSGSGPTVLGVFADDASALPAVRALRGRYADTYLTAPVNGPQ